MNESINSTYSDISTESRDEYDQTNDIRTKIVELILEEPDIKERLVTTYNLDLSHKNYNKLRELISSYPSVKEEKISYFEKLDKQNKSILLQSDNEDVINTFYDLVNKDPIWLDRVINEAKYLLKLNDRINDITNNNLEIIKKKKLNAYEKQSTQSPQSTQSTNPFRKGIKVLPRSNKSTIGGRRKKMKNKSTKIRTKQKT